MSLANQVKSIQNKLQDASNEVGSLNGKFTADQERFLDEITEHIQTALDILNSVFSKPRKKG